MSRFLSVRRRTVRRHNRVRNVALTAAVGTAALGSVACWVAHKARQAEAASPPKGKFITVDGVRLHYLDIGEGPPVVLLHGNMLRAQDFVASGLLARLATTHRVIAVDRCAYAGSWSADR